VGVIFSSFARLARLSLEKRVPLVLGNRLFVELGALAPLHAPLELEETGSLVLSPELSSRLAGLNDKEGVSEAPPLTSREERELSKMSSLRLSKNPLTAERR
jgi:hypothetical protein